MPTTASKASAALTWSFSNQPSSSSPTGFRNNIGEIAATRHREARNVQGGNPAFEGSTDAAADIRGRPIHLTTNHGPDNPDHGAEIRQRLGIVCREPAELPRRPGIVVEDRQRFARRQRQEVLLRACNEPQTVGLQTQVVDDLLCQQPRRCSSPWSCGIPDETPRSPQHRRRWHGARVRGRANPPWPGSTRRPGRCGPHQL